jgi:hypothetical protein
VKGPRIRLGDDQAEWVVADRLVSSDSIVYSVGIGEDISFDQDLIARYRCRVFGWDPTPLATDFVGRSESPGGFMFLHYGLGAEDCVKEVFQQLLPRVVEDIIKSSQPEINDVTTRP